jgi:hypothetical protein
MASTDESLASWVSVTPFEPMAGGTGQLGIAVAERAGNEAMPVPAMAAAKVRVTWTGTASNEAESRP